MGFIPFHIVDLIDILLVATLMFSIWRATKGTNAPYILTGIIVVYLAWVIVRALNMELLSGILGQVISVGVIALFIVFQPEIRQFLQMIGMKRETLGFISRIFAPRREKDVNISPIANACKDMAETKTGALIVLGQQNPLNLIIDGGIKLDAVISQSLLKNIFFKNAPLHDGAVIIENNRIVAAKCILPVTQSAVPKAYGTRHRAAIGMSEISDAIIIVVSEETGGISIAYRGELKKNIDPTRLAQAVTKIINSNIRQAEKDKDGTNKSTSTKKEKQAAKKEKTPKVTTEHTPDVKVKEAAPEQESSKTSPEAEGVTPDKERD